MSSSCSSDIEAVEEAVMTYVEGIVDFQFDKAESPWHQDGVKISYNAEAKTLNKKTIGETRPNLDQSQIGQMMKRVTQQGRIESSDVTGNAAFVKLVWDFQKDGEKKEITDYILLLKIDGEWKIVGKAFNETAITGQGGTSSL
ncbi:MAG: nuclear transport factor 2 family protein [Candidatus Thorarchaeota archaeon]|nr:MAG: nuclear transport factor 2 family protein [Candidatus Thorarchaeota archaeon]